MGDTGNRAAVGIRRVVNGISATGRATENDPKAAGCAAAVDSSRAAQGEGHPLRRKFDGAP